MTKFQAGENVSIGVIGSSITIGVGVGEAKEDNFGGTRTSRSTHRYSTLLEQLLQGSEGRSTQIRVDNLALGACATSCWLNELYSLAQRRALPDLLIAEMIMDPRIPPGTNEFRELLLQFSAFRIPVLFMTGFLTTHKGKPRCNLVA